MPRGEGEIVRAGTHRQKDWIEYREVRGYYTFTKDDIEKQFPAASQVYIKTALYRLAVKSRIISHPE